MVRPQKWSTAEPSRFVFDCFLTVDRNLQFQQNPTTLPIAVVVIAAKDNKFETLQKSMRAVRAALDTIKRGECITIRV
jgi:hypothetical protein